MDVSWIFKSGKEKCNPLEGGEVSLGIYISSRVYTYLLGYWRGTYHQKEYKSKCYPLLGWLRPIIHVFLPKRFVPKVRYTTHLAFVLPGLRASPNESPQPTSFFGNDKNIPRALSSYIGNHQCQSSPAASDDSPINGRAGRP